MRRILRHSKISQGTNYIILQSESILCHNHYKVFLCIQFHINLMDLFDYLLDKILVWYKPWMFLKWVQNANILVWVPYYSCHSNKNFYHTLCINLVHSVLHKDRMQLGMAHKLVRLCISHLVHTYEHWPQRRGSYQGIQLVFQSDLIQRTRM